MFMNYIEKSIAFCVAFAMLSLTGCNKNDSARGRGPSIIPIASSDAVKGLIQTTESLNYEGQTFGMQGYLDDDMALYSGEEVSEDDKADYHFLKDAVVEYTGDNETHSWDWSGVPAAGTEEEKNAARPKWRSGIATRFWSYYPAGIASIVDDLEWPGDDVPTSTPSDAQQKVVRFSYVQPEPDATEPYQDAENEQDLLFAFNEQVYRSASDQVVHIHFYHALAAVNFDITTMGSTVEFGTEITLANVKNSGGCTVSGNPSGNVATFAWTDLTDTALESYSQSFDKAADFETLGTAPNEYKRQKVGGNKTFFMIPQKLSADTRLRIAFFFKNGGVPVRREMEIGKLHPTDPDFMSWEAGKIYTYRITVGGSDYSLIDATLNVSDWVDGKKDVSF